MGLFNKDSYNPKNGSKDSRMANFGFYATVITTAILITSQINNCSENKKFESSQIARDSIDARVMSYEIKKPEIDKMNDFVYNAKFDYIFKE